MCSIVWYDINVCDSRSGGSQLLCGNVASLLQPYLYCVSYCGNVSAKPSKMKAAATMAKRG